MSEDTTKKMMMLMPEAVKSINAENRSVTAVLSTPTIDRDGEIIEPSAYKSSLAEFQRNPVMLWMHRYDQPIGSWRDLRITDTGLEGTAMFARTALAEDIWQLYRDSHVKAFSVGFSAKKYERRNVAGRSIVAYTDLTLYEVSAVTVPANPDALVRSAAPSDADLLKLIKTAVESTVSEAVCKHLSAEPGSPLHLLIQDTLEALGYELKSNRLDGDGEGVPLQSKALSDPAVLDDLKGIHEQLKQLI